ncbi:hypothetical protein FNF29_02134 [Cafeteria roenbergensis]|uniref:Uncharacterized protein n=1 Tax=Cafeteria roenbergensis TaxID=33653 RepID=A0A5A8CS56_CAFRO|nr:hypothetical protein FNF29_02134 [Cafeteria roenbergensis]|eukprot:KAA0154990.1 hypothetical protein FNF29_02134 [Cafeteria roenbergensis]
MSSFVEEVGDDYPADSGWGRTGAEAHDWGSEQVHVSAKGEARAGERSGASVSFADPPEGAEGAWGSGSSRGAYHAGVSSGAEWAAAGAGQPFDPRLAYGQSLASGQYRGRSSGWAPGPHLSPDDLASLEPSPAAAQPRPASGRSGKSSKKRSTSSGGTRKKKGKTAGRKKSSTKAQAGAPSLPSVTSSSGRWELRTGGGYLLPEQAEAVALANAVTDPDEIDSPYAQERLQRGPSASRSVAKRQRAGGTLAASVASRRQDALAKLRLAFGKACTTVTGSTASQRRREHEQREDEARRLEAALAAEATATTAAGEAEQATAAAQAAAQAASDRAASLQAELEAAHAELADVRGKLDRAREEHEGSLAELRDQGQRAGGHAAARVRDLEEEAEGTRSALAATRRRCAELQDSVTAAENAAHKSRSEAARAAAAEEAQRQRASIAEEAAARAKAAAREAEDRAEAAERQMRRATQEASSSAAAAREAEAARDAAREEAARCRVREGRAREEQALAREAEALAQAEAQAAKAALRAAQRSAAGVGAPEDGRAAQGEADGSRRGSRTDVPRTVFSELAGRLQPPPVLTSDLTVDTSAPRSAAPEVDPYSPQQRGAAISAQADGKPAAPPRRGVAFEQAAPRSSRSLRSGAGSKAGRSPPPEPGAKGPETSPMSKGSGGAARASLPDKPASPRSEPPQLRKLTSFRAERSRTIEFVFDDVQPVPRGLNPSGRLRSPKSKTPVWTPSESRLRLLVWVDRMLLARPEWADEPVAEGKERIGLRMVAIEVVPDDPASITLAVSAPPGSEGDAHRRAVLESVLNGTIPCQLWMGKVMAELTLKSTPAKQARLRAKAGAKLFKGLRAASDGVSLAAAPGVVLSRVAEAVDHHDSEALSMLDAGSTVAQPGGPSTSGVSTTEGSTRTARVRARGPGRGRRRSSAPGTQAMIQQMQLAGLRDGYDSS